MNNVSNPPGSFNPSSKFQLWIACRAARLWLRIGALALVLAASASPSFAAPAIGLVDFSQVDGDLTVASTNAPPGPWTYDPFRGSWSTFDQSGCATAPRSSRLTTPGWTVVSSGQVTLSFTHRYSWEDDGTTRWDGGQVRLSVNGAAFATLPAANFTANGYNNTVGGASVPTSELAGQPAFTGESTGYAAGTFLTSAAGLGPFNAGDVISVQFIAAWDDCSEANEPSWEITRLQFTPALEDRRTAPVITNPALPANAAIQEGKAYTLTAAVTGQTSVQWFKDGLAISGATALSYTIASATPDDAGQYHLEAYNAIGTTVTRVATISVTADHTAPRLLLAFFDATDPTRVTLWVDEPLCTDELACGSAANDNFNYAVESLDGSESFEAATATVTDGTNVVIVTSLPHTVGQRYRLRTDRGLGIGDRFNNVIPAGDAAQVDVLEPVVFQQNRNGYTGTQDTELRGAAPGVVQGVTATFVTVDLSDAGGISQGLLRFDGLFGPDTGQIPVGATILSARLTLTHGNGATPDGDLVNVHRMLVPWDESTATYNSLGAGVAANDVEAVAAPDFVINSAGITTGAKLTFDVARSVQAWASGAANLGWAMLPTGGNGYRWDASESSAPDSQPRLEVLFTLPPCAPVEITQQPAPATTLNEGGSFTLSVAVISQGCPPTFQWTRNGSDLPGATSSVYSVSGARPGPDSGVYRVRVANALPSVALSAPANVTVVPDTIRPTVLSAVSEADLVTITVTFSEPVSAAAANASSYTLTPAAGGAPVSLTVTRVDATTIRLTTAARALGSTHNLTVSGVTDLAATPNSILPVTISIGTMTRRLLPADAVWSYDQNGNYDETLDGPRPWTSPLFDDSTWLTGQGIFGLETTAVIEGIPLPGPAIRTPWTVGAAQLTYYLRTTVIVPAAPAGAVVLLRHATDDGMVAYVDGVEKASYNMGSGRPVLNGDLASAASPEGVVTCAILPGVPTGTHTLAIEVHQASTTSSDIVFGAEVLQVIPPRLQAARTPGGVALTWPMDPGWFLVESPTVNGPFTAVTNAPTSPFTIANPAGSVFYQLRCR